MLCLQLHKTHKVHRLMCIYTFDEYPVNISVLVTGMCKSGIVHVMKCKMWEKLPCCVHERPDTAQLGHVQTRIKSMTGMCDPFVANTCSHSI